MFRKTIIHKYSDLYTFNFNDFIHGTLSLLQYGLDNGIHVKINLEDSYLSQYFVGINTDTYGFTTKDYLNNSDIDLLYNDLEDFRTNTAIILIVTTNWHIHSSKVSEFALIDLKKMLIFNDSIYSLATQRLQNILNIHLPHTDPIINKLIPQNHVFLRDPRIHEHPAAPVSLPTDYKLIYVDINEKVILNYLDTLKLADTIRRSLILDKNILLLSSNKELGNTLNKLLTVNYVPNIVLSIGDASGSLDSLSWEPVDEIVNCVLIANAKKLFVFTEQSKPVNEGYLGGKQLGQVSTQIFKFFYLKIEISPMR